LVIGAVAFAPSDPKIIYVGTAGLNDVDLDEVRLYALFRKSRRVARHTK
jgi:hypothetical protein